jgi:hypothetical protein
VVVTFGDLKGRRVHAYIRESSVRQADADHFGPDTQRAGILAFCAKHALEAPEHWYFDKASGRNVEGPEDLLGGPSLAETLGWREYGPDGKEKKPLSAVEAYYERQERQLNGGIDSRDRDKERDRGSERGGERDRDELAGAKKHSGLPEDSDDAEEKDKADRSTEKNQTERDLRGLRALKEEALLKHYVVVSLEPRPRTVDGIRILPWQQFLEQLWAGAFV